MNNRFLNIILRCLLIIALALPAQSISAAFSRHMTSIVSDINCKHADYYFPVTNLKGTGATYPGKTTIYYSGQLTDKPADEPNFITVKIKDGGLSRTDDGDLVVYLRRTISYSGYTISEAQPVVFGVKCSYNRADGKSYTSETYNFILHFQYRGPCTEEYSERIPISKIWDSYLYNPSTITKIHTLYFYPLATNSDDAFEERPNKLRDTALNSFDVLRVPHGASVADNWTDNFHLKTDYRTELSNFKFRHTQGIFDDVNQVPGWERISDAEKNQLSAYGIEIPEFEKISNKSTKNKPICELAQDQELQPTHEVEHILYAMPGDVINLYPYYELYHTDQFYENFSHWYDYKTGGRLKLTADWNGEEYDLLDFLTEPENIHKTANEGFFAGYSIAGKVEQYNVTSVQEYIDAVNAIEESKAFSYININAPGGLDFQNRTDIPMLGDGYGFKGIINGNGTTIKNLKYDKESTPSVGLIGTGQEKVLITNITLDASCTFIGKNKVGGFVGTLNNGILFVSDVKTEATLNAIDPNPAGEKNCGGILGEAPTMNALGFTINNCYIGGTIGKTGLGNQLNAAIGTWWGVREKVSFTNVVVNCRLLSPDNTAGTKYYIRYKIEEGEEAENNKIDELPSGAKSRLGITFENCYGDLQPGDLCWKAASKRSLPENANLTNWNLSTPTPTPPMSDATSNSTKMVGSVADYIAAANAVNSGSTNLSIELTADLYFGGQAGVPMIGNYDSPYTGHFNGCGHKISGLKIEKISDSPEDARIGMFGCVKNGAIIENIIVDNTCEFKGYKWVALIGGLYEGGVTVRNVKTEAHIVSLIYNYNCSAAGILGMASNSGTNNYINMSDVYIGGKIDGVSSYDEGNKAIVGYLDATSTTTNSTFKNVVIDCELNAPANSGKRYIGYSKPEKAVFTNCYSNGIDENDSRINQYQAVLQKLIAEWPDKTTPTMTASVNSGYLVSESTNKEVDHKPGTVATFYCPRNPNGGLSQSLFPEGTSEDEKEYIIAADFSKTFKLTQHLDIDNNTISEPVIAFRHIFRIRDGKAFADENFSSYTRNRAYVRRNQKMVSARCNAPFQIRLATPVPDDENNGGTKAPTNIYYKKSADSYGRVTGTMEIILLNGDTREVINDKHKDWVKFEFGDSFEALGERTVDGVNYSIGDGKNKYFRMLKCKEPKEGHYIVQLVATTDKSNSENRIRPYIEDGTNDDDNYLIVAEYNIRFLPLKGATMLTMDALYDDNNEFEYARVETLEKKYDKPIDVIDFDEYININTKLTGSLRDKLITANETKDLYGNEIDPSKNDKYKVKNGDLYHTFFKWPIPWDKANYAYGFNYRDGYNMYMLTTHSDLVAYKQAVLLRDYFTYGPGNRPDYTDTDVLNRNDPDRVKGNMNAYSHGKGLYDVKYYKTKRLVDEYYKKYPVVTESGGESRAGSEEEKVPEIEQGYFYWGNAASDPGVATRLEINDLCPGSTIHVSAWVSEFSIDVEASNLSFNFVAVMKQDRLDLGMKEGDRIVLHSFVTGYVPDGGKFYEIRDFDASGHPTGTRQRHWVYNIVDGKQYYDLNRISLESNEGCTTTTGKDKDMRGQWLNVYYSFVPRLAEFGLDGISQEDVYYELELDNNAKSSKGADFGIDDIRIYLQPPTVKLQQVKPACKGEPSRIRMISPFETLLEIAKTPETVTASQQSKKADLAVYYTIIKKSTFDTQCAKYQEEGLDLNTARIKAYEDAYVQFNYNRSQKEVVHKFGKITFNSLYNENPYYETLPDIDRDTPTDSINITLGVGYRRTEETGERNIIVETFIPKDILVPESEYWIVLNTCPNGDDIKDEDNIETIWNFFDMFGQCTNKNIIKIISATLIRVNGTIQPSDEKIKVCEHQNPVIQINVAGTHEETGEDVQLQQNVPFDWFYGTKYEYQHVTEADMKEGGSTERTLENALQVFRKKYHYADETDLKDIKADPDYIPGEEIKDELVFQWMLDLIKWAAMPSEQYPEPRLSLYKRSYPVKSFSLQEGEESREIHVVAIPIDCVPVNGKYLVCSTPTEVPVIVSEKAPKLRHGLPYMTYPDNLDNVPLRLGLHQIREDKGISANPEYEMKKIAIPVRLAASTDVSIKELALAKERKYSPEEGWKEVASIVLVQSNDPDCSSLIESNDDPSYTGDHEMPWVGEVVELVASTTTEGAADNVYTVQFDYNKINFKEGYYYTMRFDYSDGECDLPPAPPSEDGEETPQRVVCKGQELFTLHVVPKYLKWNGGTNPDGSANLNWNNDENWVRLSHDEIYSEKKDDEHRHYVTDGLNNNTSAYAPLDFTHVVVSNQCEAPYLYAPVLTEVKPASATTGYMWPEKPSEKDPNKTYNDYPSGDKAVGNATDFIQYAMTGFDYKVGEGPYASHTGFRPWYANTCKEIHFKPGGTIMNQHELVYQRAWVDVEIDPMRWYTLSLPLKEVYAGDFYLPTANARQETELFQDIVYNSTLNNRFKPAVFQRGWDKSEARVYELENQSFDQPKNVAVSAFWSHVYNDVTEQYGAGTGFSVKTDVSRLGENWTDRVMFRFPKNDEEFWYYEDVEDSKTPSKGHRTGIERKDEEHYRLSDPVGTISAHTATKGNYFLVGNPFMTHFDVNEFLKANSDVLEQKYWIVTANGQIAGSLADGNSYVAVATPADDETVADPTVVAPMQGFFVKTKEAKNDVSLNYNASMMRRYGSSDYLTSTARSEEGVETFKITAYNDGMASSAAIVVPINVDAADVEAFDNRDLDVAATVYTVKGNAALSVNMLADMEGMEIGVIADEDTKTVLRFEGVTAPAYDLCLYDKADGSITQLQEGMAIAVNGPVAGRLFLTAGIPDERLTSAINWNTGDGNLHVTDISRSGGLSVAVFDITGRKIASVASNSDTVAIPLARGIYMAQIVTAKEKVTIKFRM